ncbi:S-layer homology domain-containing protein [Paenibacillus sp. YN15]|uniref:S-layer homology domain-containing protein n=1 Tax=Paenibacillus sp. YN15 TaxID=1742774 RepID=UPI000DCECE5E|nr:S-layer homology domain-containing protein [Paenibacillus sp. YN15]RAV06585.1 hypothetical protein DQG13_01790 [Paenibacillus sp. YN15]
MFAFKKKVLALLLSVLMISSYVPPLQMVASADILPPLPQENSSIVTNDLSATIAGQDEADKDITVTLAIYGAAAASVTLSVYQQPDLYEEKAMADNGSGVFSATLKRTDIWTDSLGWQVKVKYEDGGEASTPYTETKIKSAVGSQDSSPLLITEIVPTATAGYHYTYVEVYNNSDKDIDLRDYTVYNTYPSGKNGVEWSFDGKNNPWNTGYHPAESIMLPAGKTIILWPTTYNSPAHTVADFNNFYGTNVAAKDIVKVNHGGIHTTEQRSFRIGKSLDSIIATSVSNDGNVQDNPDKNVNTRYSNQYTYRLNGKTGYKFTKTGAPSPGHVDSWQIPDSPYHLDEPGTINPITNEDLIFKAEYGIDDDVAISARVTGSAAAGTSIKADLYYKQAGSDFKRLEMAKASNDPDAPYTVTIDRQLLWTSSFSWYIEAYDGINRVKSAEKTSTVELDYSNLPPLIFTEAVPVYKSGHQLTYAEVYNNSDSPINMGYYNLYYQYLDSTTAPKTWIISTPEVNLEPGKTLVLWLSNNGTTSVADFNAAYGTNLELNKDIVRIDYSGFHASNWRRLSIGTSLDTAFTHAEFNENNVADTASGSGRSVQYTFPRDPAKPGKSLKVSNQTGQTPGRVEDWQVPPADKRVHFQGYLGYTDNGSSPVISEENVPEKVNEGEEYFASFNVSDSIGLVGMTIGYRFDNETSFKTVYEKTQRVKGKYFARIPATEILKHNEITFYVEGYNLFRKTRTEKTYTVTINRLNKGGLRLNVVKDQFISGVKTITANNAGGKNDLTKILVDGNEVPVNPVLENGAYLSLDTAGQNNYFKNAVTAPYGGNDRELVSYLGRWTNLSSRAILIDNKYFQAEENGDYTVKLTVWAGGQGTPFEDIYKPDVNREDFTVMNVKLVLANGEEFTAARAVQDYRYSGDSFYLDVNNPAFSKVYSVGDSKNGKMAPSLDLYFTIPKEKLTAVGYALDSTTLADGVHTITAVSGETPKANPVNAEVMVDNTAPVIHIGIEPDAVVSGTLVIDPVITDNDNTKINPDIVTLDGTPISIPYSIPTRELVSGIHTLYVSALDMADNEAEKTITFKTDTKDPAGVKVQTGEVSQYRAKLSATVEELNGDSAKVEFLKGRILTVENGDIAMSGGVGKGNIEVVKGDATTTVISPEGDLPYQLFQVKVGNLNEDDRVSANWNGAASYADNSRALSMYVLNLATNRWELLGRADENGSIVASFAAKDRVENGNAVLLVQCRADDNPSLQTQEAKAAAVSTQASGWDGTGRPDSYDFSFAWITDTQYYTESWPHHYLQQNQWIVDNAKEWDIRYTIHTGDVVDEWDMDYQWQAADKAMKIFEDNGMRYGVLGGNHDVGSGLEYYDNYWKYFGAKRFENEAIYGGTYKNNLGHYDLLTEDGQDFIILYMSWDIYTDEINWMNQVLQKYKDRKAIIATHRYTNSQYTSSNPDGLLDYQGYVLREQVVAKNPNVFAVLNGHYHGASIQIDAFDDNNDGTKERLVYQICTDYQSDVEGGSQYIKFLYFDLKNNKVYMNSYSPYREDFNYYDEPKVKEFTAGLQKTDYDIYELDVNFDIAAKSLSTNRFSASVYTQDSIGSADTVAGKAELYWNGLNAGAPYSWYARVTNNKGGVAETPIQVFRTAEETSGEESGPSPSPAPVEPGKTTDPAATPPIVNTVPISINGKAVQAKQNADGSITLSESEIANADGSGIVLALPAELKSGQNGNALVTVLKKDGREIVVPFSIYGDNAIKSLIRSPGDYSVRYNLKTFGDITDHWAEKDIAFVTAREIFQGVGDKEFAPDVTMTRAMFVAALARLDGADLSGYTGSRFGDVADGQWYLGAVEWATEHNIVNGVSETQFSPEAPVTREQMAVMLHNFIKAKGQALKDKAEAGPFQDSGTVSPWAADSVTALRQAGVIDGKPGNIFDPQGMSTRAEVSSIFARFITGVVQ